MKNPSIGIYLIIFSNYFLEWAVKSLGFTPYLRWLSTLITLLLFFLALTRLVGRNGARSFPGWLIMLLSILIAITGISVLFNKLDLIGLISGARRPFEPILLFTAILLDERLHDIKLAKRVLATLFAIGLLQIPSSLFEFFFYDTWINMQPATLIAYDRFDSATGFMTHTGILGVLTIYFFSWVGWKNMIRQEWYNYTFLILFLIVFYVTYSRASWLIAGGILPFYLYLYKGSPRVLVKILIGATLMIVALILGDLLISPLIFERTSLIQAYMLDPVKAFSEQEQGRGRIVSIAMTFDYLKTWDEVLFGIGPGITSESLFGLHNPTGLDSTALWMMGGNVLTLTQLGATVLDFGILFFATYLLIVSILLVKTIKAAKYEKDDTIRPFFQALIALDLIMIVGTLYNPVWYENQVSFIFWFGSAMVILRSSALNDPTSVFMESKGLS